MSRDLATRLLPLLDLTSLEDTRDDDIPSLCSKAITPFGSVAAVCSWPEFAATMKRRLATKKVAVAVVIDFPRGEGSPSDVAAEVRAAVQAGADELDLVFPYRTWLAGDRVLAVRSVRAAKAAAQMAKLKVILETGAFDNPASITLAARDVIEAGADMIKTSTGKTSVGATPAAATAILEAIRATDAWVGFKASGGVRTIADAGVYLEIAERMLGPAWVVPDRFRIGASKLLDHVLEALK